MSTEKKQQQQQLRAPKWTSASSEEQLRKIFDTTKKPVIMFLLIHSSTTETEKEQQQQKESNNNQSIVTRLKQLSSKAFEKYFFTQEKLVSRVTSATSSNNNNNHHQVFQLVEWKINLMEQGSFSKTLAAAMNVPLLGVTLGAVFNGELLDMVKIDDGLPPSSGSSSQQEQQQKEIDEDLLTTFSQKFAQFCSHKLNAASAPAGADVAGKNESGGASVDIAKLLQMGKDLLSKRSPVYAEKFFGRAIDTLDAVINDPAMQAKIQKQQQQNSESTKVDDDNISDMCASLADALAWRALARFILGDTKGLADDVTRISSVLKISKSAEESARAPLGIVLRAETLSALTDALANLSPNAKWDEKECSEKILRGKIEEGNKKKGEKSELERALLIFTLFLSGDMERCLTEAIKLKTYDVAFGNSAVNAITRFLGPEHELVKRL